MKEFKEIIESNKEIKEIYQKRYKQIKTWNILRPIVLLLLICTIFGSFIVLLDSSFLVQLVTPIVLLCIGGLIIFRLDYNCSIQKEELKKINNYLLENSMVERREVRIITLEDGNQIGILLINDNEIIVPISLQGKPVSILKYYQVNNNLEPEIKEEILRGEGLSTTRH